MAERPIFIPNLQGSILVMEVLIPFTWHTGMAPSQKRKNVEALHQAANTRGFFRILEISSKSDLEIGRRLSAFHQKVSIDGEYSIVLECAYQGSKVFETGGPFIDIFDMDPRSAKRDERLKNSGNLKGFRFLGNDFPLYPKSIFYDWLYTNAIYKERDWLRRLGKLDGFSDIEFNPDKSINCQARACALFVSLEKRDILDRAMSSFEEFLAVYKVNAL